MKRPLHVYAPLLSLAVSIACASDRPEFGKRPTDSSTEQGGSERVDAGDVESMTTATDDTAMSAVSTTDDPGSTGTDPTSTDCDKCAPGTTQCADGEISTCVQEAGCWIWGPGEPCSAGACENTSECATCTDACSTDATACSDGEVRTCAQGPQGCSIWLEPTPCATGECADDLRCVECADTCEPGEARCVDGELSHCEEDPLGCLDWGAPTACETGTCTTQTACAACDDVCAIGDTSCQDDTLSTCEADSQGCLVWSEPTSCPHVCNANTGACGACDPGAQRCEDDQPQECNADGEWEDSGAACGQCASCEASSGTCVVATGASCDDDNACTTGETCQANGACNDGSAVTCTGADQCHTVGVCQPATGCPAPTVVTGSCNDDNPCIINETCQASGMCGGGVPASHTTACGTNEFCDGSGSCGCRTKSSWNLLANPGFDGPDSWTLNNGAIYTTVDADDCSGSGSVLIQELTATVSQCVPGTENTTYFLGYRFKTLGEFNGSGAIGYVSCQINFVLAGDTCDERVPGAGETVSLQFNTDNWTQASGSATSPPGTGMVRIHCAGGGGNGYFDQIYLSTTSPGTPAF